MSSMRHTYLVNLRGNIKNKANSYARSFENMSLRSQRAMQQAAVSTRRHMGTINSVIRKNERSINKWGARSGVAMTAAATLGIRSVGTLQENVRQLGVDADLTGDKLKQFEKSFKNKLFTTAIDFRVDPKKVEEAVSRIISQTGDRTFVESNMENIAMLLRSSTTMQGRDAGGLLSALQFKGIKSPEKVSESLDAIIKIGKAGSFLSKDTAQHGPKIFGISPTDNEQQIRETMAALQFIQKGTGEAAQSVTALDAFLRLFTDKAKLDKFEKVLWHDKRTGKDRKGLPIYDEAELKKGKEVLKPVTELMMLMVEASKGNKKNLSGVGVDSESMKAMNYALSQYNKGIDVRKELESLVNTPATGTLKKDSESMKTTLNANLGEVKTRYDRYLESRLNGAVDIFTKALEKGSIKMETVFDAIGLGALGLGGLYLKNKITKSKKPKIKLPKIKKATQFIQGAAQGGKSVAINTAAKTTAKTAFKALPIIGSFASLFDMQSLNTGSDDDRYYNSSKRSALSPNYKGKLTDWDQFTPKRSVTIPDNDIPVIKQVQDNIKAIKNTQQQVLNVTSVQATAVAAKVVSDAAKNTADQAAQKAIDTLSDKPGKVVIDVHNYDHRSSASVTVKEQPSRVKIQGGKMMRGLVSP